MNLAANEDVAKALTAAASAACSSGSAGALLLDVRGTDVSADDLMLILAAWCCLADGRPVVLLAEPDQLIELDDATRQAARRGLVSAIDADALHAAERAAELGALWLAQGMHRPAPSEAPHWPLRERRVGERRQEWHPAVSPVQVLVH